MRSYSPAECLALLKDRQAANYAPAIAKCVPAFADQRHRYAFAASIDASYNAGISAFCRSRMARTFNAGSWQHGCDLFLGWYATARINGSDGLIDVPAMLHHPAYLEVRDAQGAVERIDTPMKGNGLHYQAEEVHRCLRAGLLESAVMPLADSCAIAHTLDRAREQIGLRYPGEGLPQPNLRQLRGLYAGC